MNETEIRESIKNYCTAALNYGVRLKKPLDGSLTGILNLEKIFEILFTDLYANPVKLLMRRITKKTLTMEHIEAMSKILGAYLGEHIRAKLGDDCKWVESEEDGFYLEYKGQNIYPMKKAFDRLVKGKKEENVVSYYKSCIKLGT